MVFLLFKTKIKGWTFNKNKDEHLTKTLEVFIKFVVVCKKWELLFNQTILNIDQAILLMRTSFF